MFTHGSEVNPIQNPDCSWREASCAVSPTTQCFTYIYLTRTSLEKQKQVDIWVWQHNLLISRHKSTSDHTVKRIHIRNINRDSSSACYWTLNRRPLCFWFCFLTEQMPLSILETCVCVCVCVSPIAWRSSRCSLRMEAQGGGEGGRTEAFVRIGASDPADDASVTRGRWCGRIARVSGVCV